MQDNKKILKDKNCSPRKFYKFLIDPFFDRRLLKQQILMKKKKIKKDTIKCLITKLFIRVIEHNVECIVIELYFQ